MTGVTYRREIDGLRAIAVMSVVLYHAGIAPRAGFVGVDIFFVISGYLITALLLREHIGTGRIDLLAFYARRVRRIFPAALVVVLAALGIAGLLLPPAALTRTADSASAAVLFGANIFFQAVTGGYFDTRAEEMPLLHLWSLSSRSSSICFGRLCLSCCFAGAPRPSRRFS
jgi:peptidoglycan/LPS O-acetylase OafA/YrhL